MVCEGLLNYFGTSSEEIAEKATKQANEHAQKIYLPQIEQLASENDRLKLILEQHNINY